MRSSRSFSAAALLALGLAGCGDEGAGPGDGPDGPGTVPIGGHPDDRGRVLPEPRLIGYAPGEVTVGERVTVFGEGFVTAQWGQTEVQVIGTFTTANGTRYDVDYSVPASFQSTAVASLPVTGVAPPAGFGHDVGVFEGELFAENVNIDATRRRRSRGLPVTILVGPSLVFDELRPAGSSCQPRVTQTVEAQRLRAVVRATGLSPASRLRPIRFTWLFWKPEADISLGEAFALSEDVEAGAVRDHAAVKVVVDQVESGTTSVLDPGWFARFTQDAIETFPVPGQAPSYLTSIAVRAVDADGNEVTGRYELDVKRTFEVRYLGQPRAVRTEDPVPVSGCIAGGVRGTNTSYSESSSESRERGFSVSGGVDGKLGILKDVLSFGVGFEVGTSISSSEEVGQDLSLSGHVLPGQFGVFYRQTTQLAHIAEVFQNDACGRSAAVGEAIVTDWRWAPDLAFSSRACPPYPPSNLPPGREFDWRD